MFSVPFLPKNFKKLGKIFTLQMCFLFLGSLAHTSPQKQNQSALKSFIKAMELEAKELQGAAIAIIVNNTVVYKKVFGHTKAQGDLINENTLFSLASLSKPVVAMGIGLLVDKKVLSFNDKIILKYLKNPMPLKNFLSHTTGYSYRGDIEIESGYTRKKLINYLRKQKRNIKCTQCYSYSNIMYSLVADALETKGLNLKDVIRGLKKSIGHNDINLLPLDTDKNIAYLHSATKQELPFPSNYQKHVPAAAGLFASLNGMIEFLQLCLGNKQLSISQETLDKLYKPVAKSHDVLNWKAAIPFDIKRIKAWYGLGWRLLYLDNDSRLIFHPGYINGATTFMGFIPSHKVGIVILTNQTSKFALRTGLKFWKAVMEDNLSYNNTPKKIN